MYGKFLVSEKKSSGDEGVIFLKNTFVSIFDFVRESQSLIKKVVVNSKKNPQLHKRFIAS